MTFRWFGVALIFFALGFIFFDKLTGKELIPHRIVNLCLWLGVFIALSTVIPS